jgi:hypothetical protein
MSIQNLHIHLGQQAPGAALSEILATMQPPAAILGLVRPAIGTYWEGQGGVYVGVDRGWNGAPDGHLIVATNPASIFKGRELSTAGIDVKGATSDRDGCSNTMALADAGSELCQEILGLEIEGHKDYFLAARFQGALCYAGARELFETGCWYWLSTQSSAGSAWFQDFNYGSQYYYDKVAQFRARACRRLVL